MAQRPCGSCGSLQIDRLICSECVLDMQDRLHSVRGLYEDLLVKLSRQAVTSHDDAGVRSRSAERPLGFDWAASEAIDLLYGALDEWATTLAGTRSWALDLPAPSRTTNPKDPGAIPAARSRTVALAGWLAERVDALAQLEDAEDAFEAITFAVKTGFGVIDRPADRRFAGPCWAELSDEDGNPTLCEADLYARPNAGVVVCPSCETEHEVDARRQWLLSEARDQLLTATGASRALPGLLGREVTASTIRNLAARGSLTQHPPVGAERHPMYNVGQLIDVLIADESDRAIQSKGRRKAG